MRKTRVVCRSGSPIDSDDIDIANVQTSRSIIVLSPDSPNPDADVIKTLLAITNDKNRRSAPYHIVAEIREAPNVQVAQMVGGQEVEVVAGPDVVARITAQACGQPGLSVVYTQLLDFGGNDIYFTPVSELTGSTFGEALARFSESSVIGIKSKGQPPRLNPVGETRLGNGDQLVVISEDDDTIKLSDPPLEPAADEAIVAPERGAKPPGRTLLLGWNRGAFAVVSELARYVPPGSTMTVVAEGDSVPSEVEKAAEASAGLAVTFRFGDTTDRATLEALDIAAYDHVIVLCYSDTLDVQRADARTLVTLLHLRDIASKADRRFAIVSEMLDLRNRNLAEVAQADDFIVSDRLVSLLVTQVAENKDLNAVFRDLFDAAGSEVYIKPAADYVKMGQPVSFYTVLESARRRGEVAFGYWLNARANDPMAGFGVVINPVKGTTVTFDSGDRVIVLAAS
jgi:voltage-gated potassium channel Kch